MIGWLGALPGTYGYYAADDSMLTAGDRAGVVAYVSQIKERDPWHTVLIGSFGVAQSQEYEGIADLIGDEIYPVTSTSLLPVKRTPRSVELDRADREPGPTRRSRRSQAVRIHPPGLHLGRQHRRRHRRSAHARRARATGTATPHCDTQAPASSCSLRNEILMHAHPKLILWWSFPGHVRSGRRRHLLDLPDRRAGRAPVGRAVSRDPGPDATGRLAPRGHHHAGPADTAPLPPLAAKEHLERQQRPERRPRAGGPRRRARPAARRPRRP